MTSEHGIDRLDRFAAFHAPPAPCLPGLHAARLQLSAHGHPARGVAGAEAGTAGVPSSAAVATTTRAGTAAGLLPSCPQCGSGRLTEVGR